MQAGRTAPRVLPPRQRPDRPFSARRRRTRHPCHATYRRPLKLRPGRFRRARPRYARFLHSRRLTRSLSVARCGRGRNSPFSGSDAYSSVLPTLEAMLFFEKTRSGPPMLYSDLHLVVGVGVLDAPMVGVSVAQGRTSLSSSCGSARSGMSLTRPVSVRTTSPLRDRRCPPSVLGRVHLRPPPAVRERIWGARACVPIRDRFREGHAKGLGSGPTATLCTKRSPTVRRGCRAPLPPSAARLTVPGLASDTGDGRTSAT